MVKSEKSVNKMPKGRVNRFDVTPAFRGLLLDLTVTFLIEQPNDIIQFGIDYFAHLKSKYPAMVREKFLHGADDGDDEDEGEEPPPRPQPSRPQRTTVIQATPSTPNPSVVPAPPPQQASHPTQQASPPAQQASPPAQQASPPASQPPDQNAPSRSSDSPTDENKEDPKPFSIIRDRRKSVFAEAYNPEDDDDDDDEPIKIHPKTEGQRAALESHVNRVLLFNGLHRDQLDTVIDAMFLKKIKAGEDVIKKGDEGDYFYVVESGRYKAYVQTDTGNPKHVQTYDNSGSFGELALLYSMPRSATVTAETDGEVWCLDRATFRKIVLKSAFRKRKLYEALIDQVPLLQELSQFEKMNLADSLTPKIYEDGDIIMREGDDPDGMYFVEFGTVVIRKKDMDKEIQLTTIGKGGYFGELALLSKHERAASAYARGNVRCAFLNIEAFERLLGPCRDILARNANKYKTHET